MDRTGRSALAAVVATAGFGLALAATDHPGGGRPRALLALLVVALAVGAVVRRSTAAAGALVALAVIGLALTLVSWPPEADGIARLAGYGLALGALLAPPLRHHVATRGPR